MKVARLCLIVALSKPASREGFLSKAISLVWIYRPENLSNSNFASMTFQSTHDTSVVPKVLEPSFVCKSGKNYGYR